VGAINTLFGYLCFCFFIFWGLHYSLAVFFGTCCGIFFNFFTTGKLVFGNRGVRALPRFVAVYGLTYAVNVAWLGVSTGHGMDPYLAGAVAILPMAAFSFVLNRFLVFNHVKKND
jgi:putative flippase GtrA